MEHLVELFVAHHCPSCPDARRRVRELAASYPRVTVVERNVDEQADAAIGYGLFATPAIVVDGSAVLYGVPTLAQLVARCRAAEHAGVDSVGPQDSSRGGQPDTGLTTAL